MIVGIGSEIISVVATIDVEIWYKHVTNDPLSTLCHVASDLKAIPSSLLPTIVIIGTDVSIYVAEVHTGNLIIFGIRKNVSDVARSTPENSDIVHIDGNNTEVR